MSESSDESISLTPLELKLGDGGGGQTNAPLSYPGKHWQARALHQAPTYIPHMADILNPEVVWIEGRCYRINDPSAVSLSPFQEHDMYANDESYGTSHNDNSDEDEFEVSVVDNNRYSTSFHVPKPYLGYIIGKKGATRSRIEHETKTEIKIPRQGQSGDIVILGSSAASVRTARRRINMIVMSSRTKQRCTHFQSIPVNNAEIIANFNKFKEEILKENYRGMDESIFQVPTKLHLTLGVICLMDNEERQHAVKLLTEAKDKLLMPILQNREPLKIRMKGVSYMNDDPKEMHVLYGLVQEENAPADTIQTIADAVVDHFDRAGFGKEKDNVKLHVTLINSRYRGKDRTELGSSAQWTKRESFDGSGILERYADYDFGVVQVDSIHLSQMHSMTTPEGYYESTCVVSLSA